MANLILDNTLIEEEFFEDCRLWAIGSSIPGHALCWWLNESFGLNFYRDPDLDISIKKKSKKSKQSGGSLFNNLIEPMEPQSEVSFPVYRHERPNAKFEIFLFGNNSQSETLLPEYKNADFLLLIKDSGYLEDHEDFTKLLSKLQVIAWERELEIDNVKGRINLVI